MKKATAFSKKKSANPYSYPPNNGSEVTEESVLPPLPKSLIPTGTNKGVKLKSTALPSIEGGEESDIDIENNLPHLDDTAYFAMDQAAFVGDVKAANTKKKLKKKLPSRVDIKNISQYSSELPQLIPPKEEPKPIKMLTLDVFDLNEQKLLDSNFKEFALKKDVNIILIFFILYRHS